MKLEQLPPDDAQVIVFLDANMPNVKECKRDAECPPDRMCSHRFGPFVWVCPRPATFPRERLGKKFAVPFSRISDSEVVLWWLGWIAANHRGNAGKPETRRFVLMTHDKRFLESASEQLSSRAAAGTPFAPTLTYQPWTDTVHGKLCRITATDALGPIALDVFCIDGGFRNRNHDLRLILCCSRGLLCTCNASAPVA